MNIHLIFLIIKIWWTYYFKHLTRFLEILLRIILLELWIGERYFTFWKLVLLPDTFTIQTMLSFFPGQQTSKQNYIQSKRTKMAVLDTSSGAMFLHINEWEAICDFFRYQSRSTAPENPSWRSDTEPMQSICVHCYSQQPFKSTFWSVKSMQK